MKDTKAFINYKVKVNEVYENSNIIFGTLAFRQTIVYILSIRLIPV